MANSLVTQILNDGPRNTMLKVVGILDSSDLTNQVIVDPSTLSSIQPGMSGSFPPTFVAIKGIDFSVEDALDCRLIWDGAPTTLIEDVSGRGNFHYGHIGFLQNNAANPTGKILISTQGWTAGAVLEFTLTFWLIKQDGVYYPANFAGGRFNFSNAANGATIVIL